MTSLFPECRRRDGSGGRAAADSRPRRLPAEPGPRPRAQLFGTAGWSESAADTGVCSVCSVCSVVCLCDTDDDDV